MTQYTVSNTDTAGESVTVPTDVDTDPSYAIRRGEFGIGWDWYVHIDNGWDVNADVTIEGSHYLDESMASAAVDGATETITAGGIDFFNGTTNHSYIQVEIEPSTDPTSGDLTVTFQRRKNITE